MVRLLLLIGLVGASAAASAADLNEPFPPPPEITAEVVWSTVSVNLVAALQSENHGVRCSALQQLVAYGGDRVDVRAARFEVVRLFRDHKDPRVRMSALSALTQINDRWVTDFLFRSARFERDARLSRIYYHAARASQARTGYRT